MKSSTCISVGKRGIVVIGLALILILSGCASQTATKNMEAEKSIDENAKALRELLRIREGNISSFLGRTVPFRSLSVNNEDGSFNLSVNIEGSKHIEKFGNYIIEIKKAFESEFSESERGEITATLLLDKNDDLIMFIQPDNSDTYGFVINGRSGKPEKSTFKNADDLNKYFLSLSDQPDYNPPEITLAEFNSIKTGMSYYDVCKIIGSDGELAADSSVAKITTKIYKWKGSGSLGANASVTFQGGKVVMKAQAGLK